MKHIIWLLLALFVPREDVRAQTAISGYAISLDTGESISEAEIILNDQRGLTIDGIEPVLTAANGQFEFNGIVPGRYTLYASAGDVDNGIVQVLVSKQFEVSEDGEEIYFGFWKRAIHASQDLSTAFHEAEAGLQDHPHAPVRINIEGGDLLVSRVRLLRPKIVTRDGRDLMNVSYPIH